MDWLIIVGLIFIGTTLVIAEILFIPGIFIAGTIGVALSGFGVYSTYDKFGSTAGTLVLFGTIFLNILALYYSLKGSSWQLFSLHEKHTSRVNEDVQLDIQTGDELISISVLKPIGKALWNKIEVEVKSKGEYIEANKIVEVTNIINHQIIVKEKV